MESVQVRFVSRWQAFAARISQETQRAARPTSSNGHPVRLLLGSRTSAEVLFGVEGFRMEGLRSHCDLS